MRLVLHLFCEAKQNKPVDGSQSLVPQAQFPEFREDPSATEHGA
jgi:hypothetical protein